MQYLRTKQYQGVRTVSLNRALRRNAFDAQMIAELTEEFGNITKDKSVRAVVLTGEGTSFCAGGDLEWMKAAANLTYDENVRDAELLFDMLKTIRDLPVPVIARVFGHCFGGGLGLIAACDVVVAEEATQFCFSEVKWGLSPSIISPFVTEKANRQIVREWFLSAKVFDANEALRGGLINFYGSMSDVETYVDRATKLFREAAPEATAATKKLHQSFTPWDWTKVRKSTTELIATLRVGREGQSGLECFFNKTKPDWTLGGKGAIADT